MSDENKEICPDSEIDVIRNSDEEEQITQSDLDMDTEFFPHLPSATIRERHSDSSSDSSSENFQAVNPGRSRVKIEGLTEIQQKLKLLISRTKPDSSKLKLLSRKI